MRRSKRNMNRIMSSMLMSMVAFTALAQSANGRPTLVVGIVIDQLRSDYIELLQQRFSDSGFNRLISDGAYFENVDFSIYNPDIASSTALIFTGAYPNVNGIVGSTIYDLQKRTPVPVLTDSKKIGNFTNETFSPQAITVSTIADEVRITSGGLGYVYSIAPDAQQSIIMAGHAGNSATWINDVTGNWSTTTFYKDYPQFMSFRNYNSSLANRLDTASWKPMLPLTQYIDIPMHRSIHPFKYTYRRGDKDRFRAYKQSALVNEEVTNVALTYLQTLALGVRKQLDMLNISYTLAPYSYGSDPDFRIELQDSYLRLDAQLSRLFAAIDKAVGRGNSLVVVTSTGYFNDFRRDDEKFNIPSGEFYVARAKSLLNMYLMAIYGNGEWVIGYDNQQFFLNKELIKKNDLKIEELRAKSAEFMRKMSGVLSAYSLEDVINNPVTDVALSINRSIKPETAGDIFVDIVPGWVIVENDTNASANGKLIRDNAINTPAFIMAPGVPAQRIKSVVDASFLSPTVARLLRIRSPNAASHKPWLF